MKKEIQLDSGKKIFPVILMVIGALLAVSLLVIRLIVSVHNTSEHSLFFFSFPHG